MILNNRNYIVIIGLPMSGKSLTSLIIEYLFCVLIPDMDLYFKKYYILHPNGILININNERFFRILEVFIINYLIEINSSFSLGGGFIYNIKYLLLINNIYTLKLNRLLNIIIGRNLFNNYNILYLFFGRNQLFNYLSIQNIRNIF